MAYSQLFVYAVFTFVLATDAQQTFYHTQDPRRCVANSGITDFPGCHAWDNLVSSCNSVGDCTLDTATPLCNQPLSYFNCYCQQAYLNALYE